MRRILAMTLGILWAVAAAAGPSPAAVTGDYIEVRSADVYTGPCFANSQVGLEGRQAILAWRVREGTWQGVNLAGLSVIAVVDASATLGDPDHNPYPARAVFILDQRANASEQQALEALARSEAGKLVAHVVRVETAPIRWAAAASGQHGTANLEAGSLVRVRTRSLCAGDGICGNEAVYYPPLTPTAHALPAYTLEEAFRGQGLGMVWSREDARSAFVGNFTL